MAQNTHKALHECTPEERAEIRARKREAKRAKADAVRDAELQREREKEQRDGQLLAENVKRMRGRPSEYTDEEGDAICAWISQGKSLKSYCRERGRDAQTIYRWLRERGDFHARYARAHDDRADSLADEIQDIADEQVGASDRVAVEAAKLRIETRKWIASKLRPSKWGEKIEVNQKGSVTFNLGIGKAREPLQGTAVRVDSQDRPPLIEEGEQSESPNLLIRKGEPQVK